MAPEQLSFQREILTAELIAEAMPLLEANQVETGVWSDLGLEIDVAGYIQFEQAGAIRFYTARCDRKLVGYTSLIVRAHPHQGGTIQATQDVLYLDPAYRNGSAGRKLIEFADDQLRREGVTAVYRQATVHRAIDPLLVRIGYRQAETLYARRLN